MSTNTSAKNAPTTPPKAAASPPKPPAAIPGFSTPVESSDADPGELSFLEGLTDLDAEQKKLLIELYVANGQDAYDAEAAAVGKLKQDEYLALPQGWSAPNVSPKRVGSADVRDLFKAKDLAAIYYLNKRRAPPNENAVRYGMVRMEAVKMGWVAGQKEIVHLPFTQYKEALKEFVTDLATAKNELEDLRAAAFLLPLACEHTFRTMGHHYITGQATDYQTRYRKTLKACLLEHIANLMQPATLYHHVLHWVSPSRAYNVLSAQLDGKTLPDAIILRATAAPAGWAIITTTAAVYSAMESANLTTEIDEAYEGDLETVKTAAAIIKTDVRKWHKAYFAYNVAPPTKSELEQMNEARETAVNFAPYAQGFIEGTLKDAALGQAQALKKHSELNPIARAKAARFFRAVSRSSVANVADLFNTKLKKATSQDDD